MRIIKFRGKRKDNGEWVYGFYSYLFDERTSNYKHEIAFQHIEAADMSYPYPSCNTIFAEVIPETTGQFTGLTDKNGKEIFEEDIVVFTTYSDTEITEIKQPPVYVKWNNQKSTYDFSDNKYRALGDYPFFHWWSLENMRQYEIEIIGNIHDNPELLTSK